MKNWRPVRWLGDLRARFLRWFWRQIPGSTPGSQNRNFFSYVALVVCALIMIDTALAPERRLLPGVMTAAGACVLSLLFFYQTTIAVVRLGSSSGFNINVLRLIRDIGISILLTILAFSLIYRALGIRAGFELERPINALDHVYFSAVTFSTLGFGDFRPAAAARIWAALQAIYGNVHLGLIVGAIYLLLDKRPRAEEE